MITSRGVRSRRIVAALVLVVTASSGVAAAQVSPLAPDGARLTSGLGLLAASPVALQAGRLLGASADVSWGWSLLELGGRVQVAQARAFDELFEVRHTEGRALLDAGVSMRVGRGRLGLGAQAGLVVIREHRARQQQPRLEALGIDTTTSGWSVGPLLGLTGRLDLRVFHRFDLRLEAGPTLGWAGFADGARRALGWAGVLQVRFTP